MIREHTYYDIKCDDCEKDTATFDDFAAWDSASTAVEMWVEGTGLWHYDGLGELCDDHMPRCPECGTTFDFNTIDDIEEVERCDGFCEYCYDRRSTR